MHLTPDEAFDIVTDGAAFADFVSRSGLTIEAARAHLGAIADQSTAYEPRALRRARETNAIELHPDYPMIVAFVERAGRLPPRILDVFHLCIVEGFTRREAADRLGIAVETVRTHLRRLRMLARRDAAHQEGSFPRTIHPPG